MKDGLTHGRGSERTCCDGEPGDGGADPARQQPAGRPEQRRGELQSPAAADRSGGRAERREELRPGKLCGQVRVPNRSWTVYKGGFCRHLEKVMRKFS